MFPKINQTGNGPSIRKEHKLKLCIHPFPPDTSQITRLGFDEVQSSKTKVSVRKVHTRDRLGAPALFFEATLMRDSAVFAYGVPHGHDPVARQIRAASQFLRLASALGGVSLDAASASSALLPPLESAEKLLSHNNELLLKRFKDLQSDFAELSKKSRKLSRACEESGLLLMEKERRIAALQSRVAKLEALPGPALRDLVLDWLRSHRGEFDSSAFSRASGVPPSRGEEGLEMLVNSGEVVHVGGTFRATYAAQKRVYEERKTGWLRLPSLAFRGAGKKP